MADLRDYIPAVKYGASLQNTALPEGKVLIGDTSGLAQEKAYGTVRFTVYGSSTGTFAVSNPSIILGHPYIVESNGSPTVHPIKLVQAGATVTFSTHTGLAAGSIVYECVFMPY